MVIQGSEYSHKEFDLTIRYSLNTYIFKHRGTKIEQTLTPRKLKAGERAQQARAADQSERPCITQGYEVTEGWAGQGAGHPLELTNSGLC